MTLEEARQLAGLSRAALAELAGTTGTTIYDIETGRNRRPSFDVVTRIVRALHRSGLRGITAEQLFPVDEHESADLRHG